MVPFERALVSSYKTSIHIITLSALVCPKFQIAFFSGGCEPPILGKGRPQGVGDGTVRKSVGEFLQAVHSNFPLSLHVLEILSHLFSSMPLFPTPPVVSQKFPHVPMGVGGSPFGYKERRYWANCQCNQFPRFPTYVITIHQRYRRTDRQTDRRTTCDPKTALCTNVHCAVKIYRRYYWYRSSSIF